MNRNVCNLLLSLTTIVVLVTTWDLHGSAKWAMERLLPEGPQMVDKFPLTFRKTERGAEWRGVSSRRFNTAQSIEVCLAPTLVGTPSPVPDSGLVSCYSTTSAGPEDLGRLWGNPKDWDGVRSGFYLDDMNSEAKQTPLGTLELPPGHTLVYMCSLPTYEGTPTSSESLHIEVFAHKKGWGKALHLKAFFVDIEFAVTLIGSLFIMILLMSRDKKHAHSDVPRSNLDATR